MHIMQVILSFFISIKIWFLKLIKKARKSRTMQRSIEQMSMSQNSEQEVFQGEIISEEIVEEPEEEIDPMTAQVKEYKSSILTRLYTLRQEIAIFEIEFPTQYNAFLQRIEEIEEVCCKSLEAMQKELTFAIDPDIDSGKMGETTALEKEVERFLETEVKFRLFFNRLQQLIAKLNILYNSSICHPTKGNAISQLEHAEVSQRQIIQEVKESEHILADKQLIRTLIELISYADYLILKSRIRNSDQAPGDLIEKLAIISEFDGFEYVEVFKSFIKDEIYDLGELLTKVPEEECRRALKEQGGRILIELTYSESVEEKLWNPAFWDSFIEYETSLLEVLKENGVSEDEAKVKLIARLNIKVKEHEVLVSPVVNAYLSLMKVFSETKSNHVLLLAKLLNGMSKEVTYKEIYYLILLFEVAQTVRNVPNSLIYYLDKYQAKHPYEPEKIREKKQLVKANPDKEYVPAFLVDGHVNEFIDILEELDMDFCIAGDHVLINSFYFANLENVLSSLEANGTTK